MDLLPATKNLLVCSMLKGVGHKTLLKLSGEQKMLNVDWQTFVDQASHIAGRSEWNRAFELAERQIEECHKENIRILSKYDSTYPFLLSQSEDSPALLWVQGEFAAKQENSVAIIGSRKASKHGLLITERITQYFVRNDWSIVSGLALGCDTFAHRSALAFGGHTVAVLAHGHQMIYPSENSKLASQIIESGGALVSEYPYGKRPSKESFVKRDRIQAGLSQGVVMIQASTKGGSLHAVRASLEYHRWVSIPYPTSKDLKFETKNIEANLVLIDGSNKEKQELLRHPGLDMSSNIIVLRSKDDYEQLLLKPKVGLLKTCEAQESLF